MNEKNIEIMGWIASVCAILLNLSYADQIRLNLSGHPGSIILPIFTIINATSWIIYGFAKSKNDWPIIVCNIFGLSLGTITAITAIIAY